MPGIYRELDLVFASLHILAIKGGAMVFGMVSGTGTNESAKAHNYKICRLNNLKRNKNMTPDYYNKTFNGVLIDYYRIESVYNLQGPRGHAVKKLLRGLDKDDGVDTELQLINTVRKQLDRWENMISEERAANPTPVRMPD